MLRIRSSSKRKVKIPAKFSNTVCELNKKMDDSDSSTDKVVNIVTEMENENQGGLCGNRTAEVSGIREKNAEGFPSIVERVRAYSYWLEEGREVVVFDEEIVSEGSRKNKPLLVQKWNPGLCIEKKEPEVIPSWIKLCNVPLEAWSNKEISVITSSIGKPMIMDQTTTEMCNKGVGRIGYARVLVEVNAKNKLKNKVEICYKNAKQETCLTKFVNVLYDWMPPSCEFCKVFWHTHANCIVRNKSEEEKKRINNEKSNQETKKWNNGANQKTNNDNRDKRDAGVGKQLIINGNDKSGSVNLAYIPINKEKNDGTQNKEENKKKNKGWTDNGNGISHTSGK
ncbi:ATPase, F1/V1/A1 complex, alpha/beta subunit [Tanacetum coccineum]|uniref:ATPase, F1/V1/A1 complex, alpha/beta subunit n=1 Tax=Tanacetum coccineum TaxID=301880 RepID=A0ABQ5CSU6_9ASTR